MVMIADDVFNANDDTAAAAADNLKNHLSKI